jgi:hypothetical protein
MSKTQTTTDLMDYNIDGIEFATLPSGAIGWMRHWRELDTLIARGLVRTRFRGPGCYGHTDYVYIPGGEVGPLS